MSLARFKQLNEECILSLALALVVQAALSGLGLGCESEHTAVNNGTGKSMHL